MNIYFAAAVRGRRKRKFREWLADGALWCINRPAVCIGFGPPAPRMNGPYAELIAALSKHGTVLTEHLGSAAIMGCGEKLDSHVIFNRDMGWLRKADVLVAEVTTPSLGVGYEIAAAVSLGIRVICIWQTSAAPRISAMIVGNPKIEGGIYDNPSDAVPIFEKIFENSQLTIGAP